MPFPVCPVWLLSSGGHGLQKLPLSDLPWWMARWGSGLKGMCLNKLGGASSRQDLVFPPFLLVGRGAWGVDGEEHGRMPLGGSVLRDGVVGVCLLDCSDGEPARREPGWASAPSFGLRRSPRRKGELRRIADKNRRIWGAPSPGPSVRDSVDEAEGSEGDGHAGYHLLVEGVDLVGFSHQDAAQCCSFRYVPFLATTIIPEGGTFHAAPKMNFYFQPMTFDSQGLKFQRWNNSISVSLGCKVSITATVLEHQLCTHISIEICGQQKSWSCHYACRTINSGSVIEVQYSSLISTSTRFYWPDDYLAEDVAFSPFGLCHQRWMTTSLLMILKFNGEETLRLSSVMISQNLQLNPQPRAHTLDRPSGEPPVGNQPVWSTMEALKDCRCSNIESVLSTDERSLYNFIGNLW